MHAFATPQEYPALTWSTAVINKLAPSLKSNRCYILEKHQLYERWQTDEMSLTNHMLVHKKCDAVLILEAKTL
jgi:hypothetical protein